MCYRNLIYNGREQKIKVFTWDSQGKRTSIDCSYEPYLYIEGNGGFESIFGTKLQKRKFRNQWERSKFIQDTGITRVFDNFSPIQQFLLDSYWKDNETPEFSKHDLKIQFIDIEVVAEEFPDAREAKYPVNVITVYDSLEDKFFTWGCKEYKVEDSDVVYVLCKNEIDLLTKFVAFFRKDPPDVVSSWNGEGFDIPYIMNRLTNLFGEDTRNSLSPGGRTYFRDVHDEKGQDIQRWTIDGVSLIDYLNVYKRFSPGEKESFKLNSIAQLELGESKLDMGISNFVDFMKNDWQKFVSYNIQDVRLLKLLDKKLKFLDLIRMFAYIGLTTFESAMGSISVINGSAAIRARNRFQVMPTFIRHATAGINPGAFVGDPLQGFQKYIVSFDANSLYPNVMISLNMSTETKVGKIISKEDGMVNIRHVNGKHFSIPEDKLSVFIEKEKLALSKAGVFFSQKMKGIYPEVLDYYYKKRVETRAELKRIKLRLKELEDEGKEDTRDYLELDRYAARLDAKQLSQKVYVNATYGAFGNKNNPLGDDDIATSVTLTGQAVIQHANVIAKKFIKCRIPLISDKILDTIVVYNDTDSLYISLTELVNKECKFSVDGIVTPEFYRIINQLTDELNTSINEWSRKELYSLDSRFIFKREAIADVGIFLSKKRYILHVLDNEGIKCDKFKYVGVEVVRSTMPKEIKPHVKSIVEIMLTTQDQSETNEALKKVYDIFLTLPIESISTVVNISNYEKSANKCDGFELGLGIQHHAKASILYNNIIQKLDLEKKYELIKSGDKIRLLFVLKPNRFNIDKIAYKTYFPEEFKKLFLPDYETIFEKVVLSAIERLYGNVGWELLPPNSLNQTDIFSLFG